METLGFEEAQVLLIVEMVMPSITRATAGFQGIINRAQKKGTILTVVSKGNTSLAGASWQYETFQFKLQGTTIYVTYAVNFYQSEGRVYALAFEDTKNDTLSNLDYFGATFHG